MFTKRPERLKIFDYLGLHQYFLTFCTEHRRQCFVDSERVDLVRTQIERAALAHRFALIAYCFMPDHVHLLIEGGANDSDGRRFIRGAKQLSGFHYKAMFHQTLWQRYGYEHVLRDNETGARVARYILENPVRAGLVDRIDGYPFSGSSVYTVEDLMDPIQLASKWYRSGQSRTLQGTWSG